MNFFCLNFNVSHIEGVGMHFLQARPMGTSTAMLEAHYSKVTARMSANIFG